MTEKKQKVKSPLAAIFFTVFIDLVGLGIVIPIMAPLLLDPHNTILPFTASVHFRTLLLGFLVAVYPLAQFFGAPVLGALSDRHGRKPILLLSLLGTFAGYILFALAIIHNNIYLLFCSRLLDGFTGGNISIAYAAISDVSDDTNKAKNFGMIGAAFGLGFVLGPFIGGKLSSPEIVSWFTLATPFWFAAILSSINIIWVSFSFPETLVEKQNTPVSLITGISNIKEAFGYKDLRIVFLIVFLLTLGFNFFTQFFQVFLIDKFNFNVSKIADMFAYIGVWIVIAQGGVLRPLLKRFNALQLLAVAALLLAISLPMLLIPSDYKYLYFVIPFVSIFQGLTQPTISTVVSDQANKTEQGRILGINQSIRSLGMALPPILAAYITLINISFPILAAAFFILLGWIIVAFYYKDLMKKEQSNRFS
ncbi:MAG TPA: MFS transporter [Bacteroidia bacterium]|nr:MFS transporter [Bacteroidia bacterium]